MANGRIVDGWSVYIHTTPNGKKYVGITSKNPSKRFNYGFGYYKQPKFGNAIRKYGWKSIRTEILFDCLSEVDAKALEIELIQQYNTMNDEYGYNMTLGGEGTLGRKHTNEAKLKMSENSKGEKSPFLGKKGIDCHNSIPIMCLNTGEIFPSTKCAERKYNLSGLSHALGGKLKSCGSLNGEPLQWSRLDENGNPTRVMVDKCGYNSHKIRMIECVTTGEIFEQVTFASKKYNVAKSDISRVANGTRNFAGKLPDGTKLTWRYLDDSN